jgi:hypothetical protein
MISPSLTFDEYWDLFVRAHADPRVRRVHFVAVSAGLGCAVLGVLTRRAALLLAAPAVAFVPSWALRRLGGPGSSLPFHPPYAALASAKLWRLTVLGAMSHEVARVLREEPDEPPESSGGPLPRPNMVTDHTLH